MTEQTTTENTAPVLEKKTRQKDTRPLRERLVEKYTKAKEAYDKLTASLTELVAEINAIDTLANITVGSTVVIQRGKGETRKAVTGIVIGIKDDDDGSKLYKVSYGEGFDADVAIVKAGGVSLPAASEEAKQA